MTQVPFLCRCLLNAAAPLVPSTLREDWRREWYGELWHFIGDRVQHGDRQALRVALSHCAGAWKDAWYLRRTDEASTGALARILRHPAFCVAAVLAVAILTAAVTHGFANTRRMITPLPYRDPGAIVVIRQTGYFMGARLGLPRGKVAGWRKADTLEGIAAYAGFRALIEYDGWREVEAAAVDPAFFQVLGVQPQLGSLFQDTDPYQCPSCAVLSDKVWRTVFHADRTLVGRTRKIAGRDLRIIGILPGSFWFFAETPGVWMLAAGSGFLNTDRSLVYAIARLRQAYTAEQSLTELRRIYRTQPPVIRARQIEMRGIVELTQDRLYRGLPILMLAFFVVSVVLVCAVPARNSNLRGAAYFTAKASLSFFVAITAAIEFAYAPGLRMTGVRGFAPEAISLWVLIFGLVISLWFAAHDQRRRCRTCLARLSMPVQVGSRGHVLMEWMSTELVCPNGHGMLWAPEDPLESHPKDKWLRLDESWRELFAYSDKK